MDVRQKSHQRLWINKNNNKTKARLEGEKNETGARPSSQTWEMFSPEVFGTSQESCFFPQSVCFAE